jgi:hypothetical protein
MEEDIELEKSYTPTQAMVNNAKRGLAARQKAPKSQKGGFDAKEAKAAGVGSGVARARDVINGNLSLESVKRMYSFLSRAKTYYKPNERTASGNLTPGTQAYLLWSGSAGLSWARNILRQEGILKSVEKSLQQEYEDSVPVVKAVNDEKRIATFVVLEPQYEDDMTSDLHSDWYDEDTVFEAMMNFNRYCKKASLFHMIETDSVEFLESFTTKTDMVLGGRFIKKGTWLATIYCPPGNPTSNYVWNGIKDGTFTGLSIQCLASVEKLEE